MICEYVGKMDINKKKAFIVVHILNIIIHKSIIIQSLMSLPHSYQSSLGPGSVHNLENACCSEIGGLCTYTIYNNVQIYNIIHSFIFFSNVRTVGFNLDDILYFTHSSFALLNIHSLRILNLIKHYT